MVCPDAEFYQRLNRLRELRGYRRSLSFFRKDRDFRLGEAGKTPEEIWPLSVGYSPYSGMTPLVKPVRP